MQINITFLIQIANFWICYAIFHRFFLKPAVKQIHKKTVLEESLLQGLKEKEGILIHLQQDKKENLEVFRRYIKKQYPTPVPALKDAPAIELLPQVEGESALFAKTTCDLLVKKACDAL